MLDLQDTAMEKDTESRERCVIYVKEIKSNQTVLCFKIFNF